MQTKLEKPKFKHNKKRNTAFLFETLVKELTKAVVYNDKDRQKNVSSLIKEHFRKNSILDRDLQLYKQLYETKQFPKEAATRLLSEVRSEHEKLDESEIFDEQSKLVAKINKLLGFQVYDNFLPNYKTLASIGQIFNNQVEPRRKVILENDLLEELTQPEVAQSKKLQPIDSLALKTFVTKFNETYGKALINEQKELLSRFIANTEDDIELKIYLNEEISRIKSEVSNIKKDTTLLEDLELAEKIQRLDEGLQKLKIDKIDDELIKKVMLVQEFIHEVKS